ncbi:MAG: TRAP transporter large permease subunit, partial [Devosiaceae bacterium]|nr:TRAP transporter large permease subunit [Devosiaceae bacterium]
MPEIIIITFLLGGLLVLLAAGVWVAFALIITAIAGMVIFSSAPVGQVMATILWGASHSWALAALPMFIWMGEILLRSRLSKDMFSGLAPWLTKIPGRLLHVNVFGCALFAAVSGSSAATAATIGKMSIPELSKRGYPEKLILGTLAGSATLGLLIPPSIILIVYGVATEQSVARLFIAGILPGIMLVTMFSLYVVVRAKMLGDKIPKEKSGLSFREKIKASRSLLPVMLLIIGVIGSIYSGIASPTDAAAMGVVFSLLLAWRSGTLSKKMFIDSLMGATITSAMIAFILVAAAFLTTSMGFTGIPRDLAAWIGGFNLSPFALLFALTIFFIILGCFLDGISVVVLTTSIILPM